MFFGHVLCRWCWVENLGSIWMKPKSDAGSGNLKRSHRPVWEGAGSVCCSTWRLWSFWHLLVSRWRPTWSRSSEHWKRPRINRWVKPGITKMGKYHCTVDLLFDWFGLVCLANKNKNCQLSISWFQTSQTGGQWYSDTSPFSIPWLDTGRRDTEEPSFQE